MNGEKFMVSDSGGVVSFRDMAAAQRASDAFEEAYNSKYHDRDETGELTTFQDIQTRKMMGALERADKKANKEFTGQQKTAKGKGGKQGLPQNRKTINIKSLRISPTPTPPAPPPPTSEEDEETEEFEKFQSAESDSDDEVYSYEGMRQDARKARQRSKEEEKKIRELAEEARAFLREHEKYAYSSEEEELRVRSIMKRKPKQARDDESEEEEEEEKPPRTLTRAKNKPKEIESEGESEEEEVALPQPEPLKKVKRSESGQPTGKLKISSKPKAESPPEKAGQSGSSTSQKGEARGSEEELPLLERIRRGLVKPASVVEQAVTKVDNNAKAINKAKADAAKKEADKKRRERAAKLAKEYEEEWNALCKTRRELVEAGVALLDPGLERKEAWTEKQYNLQKLRNQVRLMQKELADSNTKTLTLEDAEKQAAELARLYGDAEKTLLKLQTKIENLDKRMSDLKAQAGTSERRVSSPLPASKSSQR